MDDLVFKLVSIAGFAVICFLAWATGDRFSLNKSTICGSLFLSWSIGLLTFWVPWSHQAIQFLNQVLIVTIEASKKGILFLFGPLALGPGDSLPDGTSSIGFILGMQVLPSIIFFSALASGLYYLKLLPTLVNFFSRLFYKFMRLSGAESLSAAANIFFGIESGLLIKPYLKQMTRSEILTLLTCMMSTVASTVMGVYIIALHKVFPQIAGHLASASLISIPCAVLISKLSLPEQDQPETISKRITEKSFSDNPPNNLMAALIEGGGQGVKLSVGIATLLIIILGFEAILDLVLGFFQTGNNQPLSLSQILKWISFPFVILLGLKPDEWAAGAEILGTRFIETEVTAYFSLASAQTEGVFSQRSLTILSYSLCGFVHIASLGIFIGGLSALAPERSRDLSILGIRSFWTAYLTTLLTGCIAGAFA